jgi:hypothetical protein
MLKTVAVAPNTIATNRLMKLWTVRYLPDLSILTQPGKRFPSADLVATASPQGRLKTIEKVSRFLQISCEMAGLETNSLYAYIPNIVHLSETRRIACSVKQVYDRTLEIYAQQESPGHFLKFIDSSPDLFSKIAMPFLMLPAIPCLVAELEPLLLRLQAEHLTVQDSRAIGFLTTQFHFSTRELLKQLTPYEQVLLSPYLRFIEEQVCIPWQRMCAAASSHFSSSPIVALVEYLVPRCHEIAHATYQQSVSHYAKAHSRRGEFSRSDIAASTIRDLTMIQGYLLLSLLEQNIAAIEQELLPLCVMVFPSVGVAWGLVEQTLHWLIEEILRRLDQNQQALILPYTQSMQSLFADACTLVSSLEQPPSFERLEAGSTTETR